MIARCPFCDALVPVGGDCLHCGAGACARCGGWREGDELICEECADAIDAAAEREHVRAHSAEVLG